MKDRELLMWSAAACGYECIYDGRDGMSIFDPLTDTCIFSWNPLTNDSAAFKLAVKLKMDISIYKDEVIVSKSMLNSSHSSSSEDFVNHFDECAAVRRAIVLEAAQIGKNKQ